ncbi:MAG: SDR family oxidoreductase [bacterium]
MDFGLTDKVALVAASSQGLGKAVAVALAKEKAKVILCSRNQENLTKAREEILSFGGADVLAIRADLTQSADIKRLVAETIEHFGTIHILVNNAGGPPAGFFWDMHDDAWQKGIDITLMSSVRLTREALPFMRKQKWGRIINITSVSVKQPIDELLLSNSLRLSVIGWAKTLANQVAKEGILINNVCPGWTRTERVTEIINGRAQATGQGAEDIDKRITETIPMGRMGRPEELAHLVVFLASECASYITGASIQVDGGAVKGIY